MTEEKSLDWYLERMALVDQKRVLFTFLLTIFALSCGLDFYVFLLYLASQLGGTIVGSILFFAIQIIIGLIATRYAFQFGSRIRQFQVPPHVIKSSFPLYFSECIISEGDIQKIFEKFQIGYDRADPKRVDDFTDLGWFFVVVLAILSMLVVLLFESSSLLIFSVVIVQGIIIFVLLVLGYKYAVSENLADSFIHLEYVVSSLILSLMNDLREFEPRIVTRWAQQLRKSILYDIAILVDFVDFGLRIGTDRPASILVQSSATRIECVRCVVPEEWIILSHDDGLEIQIPSLALNISLPSRWLLTPDTVNALSSKISTVIQTLFSDRDCTKHAS
ncbi:MAG: hypothetical protein ACTSXS_03785 [Candidatus Thorarchaeota archaeon]